jgi:hypothetical protein
MIVPTVVATGILLCSPLNRFDVNLYASSMASSGSFPSPRSETDGGEKIRTSEKKGPRVETVTKTEVRMVWHFPFSVDSF